MVLESLHPGLNARLDSYHRSLGGRSAIGLSFPNTPAVPARQAFHEGELVESHSAACVQIPGNARYRQVHA